MVYQGYKKPAKSVAFSSMGINISNMCEYCQKPIALTEKGWGMFDDGGLFHGECDQLEGGE